MQRFDCPFCGPRDQAEFTYGREVAPIPALDAPAADWFEYVYQRENPSGPHAEWWQHNHGCRQWLVIVRDTVSHAVLSVSTARVADVTGATGAMSASGATAATDTTDATGAMTATGAATAIGRSDEC